jgi:hypothetical protein
MKANKSYPTYEIRETPESLIIAWRGIKRVKAVVILSLVEILFLFLMVGDIEYVYTEYQVFHQAGITFSTTISFHIILWMCTIYFLIIQAINFSGLLLEHETITIMKNTIRIEKSGFRLINRYKQYSLDKNQLFQFTVLDFNNSFVSFSRLLKPRLLYSFFPQPSRWFCRGISIQDADIILTRIKAKFPNIKVLMYDGSLVGPY